MSNSKTLALLTTRQSLSDIIFACLFLIKHPDMSVQTVSLDKNAGFLYTTLSIVCTDQEFAYQEFDPGKIELKAFLDQMDKSAIMVSCPCRVSSDVARNITCGTGCLDSSGMWQYPCTHGKARRLEELLGIYFYNTVG